MYVRLGRDDGIKPFSTQLHPTLETRVHTYPTIHNHADYNPSAARANCVASFRFTSDLEVHLPTEVTSVSK